MSNRIKVISSVCLLLLAALSYAGDNGWRFYEHTPEKTASNNHPFADIISTNFASMEKRDDFTEYFLSRTCTDVAIPEAPDLPAAARTLKNLMSYWEECWVVANNQSFGVMPHEERCLSPIFLQDLREAIADMWKDYGCKGGAAASLSEFYLKYFPAL